MERFVREIPPWLCHKKDMITAIRKLLGYEDVFFNLLEASAIEAKASVQLLVDLLKKPEDTPPLGEFVQSRRKDKQITEDITEALCKTFVTPLEREDIEALSTALYRIPKTVEKFSEKYILCRRQLQDVDFMGQISLLEQATDNVSQMVRTLRKKASLEQVKEYNTRMHYLEGEADKLMLDLVRDLYSGKHDPLKVIIILDLYETLEKIIDRCRDVGNIVFQVTLKYS
jgi:uncharacterized protein Yka (UPF0111/DUF47 family)